MEPETLVGMPVTLSDGHVVGKVNWVREDRLLIVPRSGTPFWLPEERTRRNGEVIEMLDTPPRDTQTFGSRPSPARRIRGLF